MTNNTRLRKGEVILDYSDNKNVYYLVKDIDIASSYKAKYLLVELSRLSNGVLVSFVPKPKGFVEWLSFPELVKHFRNESRA